MKKIIPSDESSNYTCPMAMMNNYPDVYICIGDRCMKWEEEMVMQKKKDYIEPPRGSIVSPLTGYEEVPTGKGFCGL